MQYSEEKLEFEPLRSFIIGDPGAILLIEFFAESADEAREKLNLFIADMKHRHIGTHIHQAIKQSNAGTYLKIATGCAGINRSRPVVNMKTEAGIDSFVRIAEEVSNLVLEYGGGLAHTACFKKRCMARFSMMPFVH